MKTLLLMAASAALLGSTAAGAAEYNYSYSGAGGSFDFLDSSAPTPVEVSPGNAFVLDEVGTFEGVADTSFQVIFFNAAQNGGLTAGPFDQVDVYSPQLYTGPESAPVFRTLSQATSSAAPGGPSDGVFTVSAAPEPATWLLMFAGLGGIGLMLRRARKTMGFRFRDAFAR